MSARQVSHTSNTSKRPQGKTGPGPGQTTKRITWPKLLVAALVLALAGIPFILGRYMELKTPGPFDSGAYVYSAQRPLSGARLGAEERPSALTGTLLVNMLGVKLFGFSETGPKLMQALFQAAHELVLQRHLFSPRFYTGGFFIHNAPRLRPGGLQTPALPKTP